MGNAHAKTGYEVNKATARVHEALIHWDEAALTAALSAAPSAAGGAGQREAPDVGAYMLVTEAEQFTVWDAGRKPRLSELYALNALGRCASGVFLAMRDAEARTRPLPFNATQLASMVTALIRAGADVNAVIERFGVGQLTDGSTSYVRALSKTIEHLPPPAAASPGAAGGLPVSPQPPARSRAHGGDDTSGVAEWRARRAKLLFPTLRAVMASPKRPRLTLADMQVWCGTRHEGATALILEHGEVVVTRPAPSSGSGASSTAPVEVALAPLIAAVHAGSLPLVRWLLEQGADVNAADERGTTPLMYASGLVPFLPEMSSSSADEDEDDGRQRIPIVAMVEALLAAGATVSARDARGKTALHYFAASRSKRLDAATRRFAAVRLLRAGASLLQKDAAGWTALDFARDRRDAEFGAILQHEVTWLRRRALVHFWSVTGVAARDSAAAAAAAELAAA